MGLFGLLRKSPKQQEEEASRRQAATEDLEIYQGMRVEVHSKDGRMFLAGRLTALRGDRAQLEPFADGSLMTEGDAPVPVTIRGFSSLENKAVLMEGTIRMGPNKIRYLEHISLVKMGNDRAFFRLDADVEGTIMPLKQITGTEQERCRVINVSVGGACIGSQVRRNVGNKFLLWVRLLPRQPVFEMRCQIVRIIERRHNYYEYGCKFLDLSEAEENRILQAVFELQRQKRQS